MCSPMISSSSCYLSSSVPPFSPQYTVFFFPALYASKTLPNSPFLHDNHFLSSYSASYLAIVISSLHIFYSSLVSAMIQRWLTFSWADVVSFRRCSGHSNLYFPHLNRLWSESKSLQTCDCQIWRSSMSLKMKWLASEMEQISKNRASRRSSKQEKKDGIYIMKSSGRYEQIHQTYKKTQKISKNMFILASKAWLSPRRTS